MSYSACAVSRTRRIWQWWSPLLFGAAIPVLFIVALSQIEPNTKERQVCDALVQTLLTTRDAVELQRTEILVHELNCDVSHRAGPALYRQLVPTGQG
jgi:hypothetical protein